MSSRISPAQMLDDIVLRCMNCGARESAVGAVARCSICGGLLDVELDLSAGVSPQDFLVPPAGPWATSGVWRYQALLPRLPDSTIVSRSEGRTPIYEDERLRAFAGVDGLGFETRGPEPDCVVQGPGNDGWRQSCQSGRRADGRMCFNGKHLGVTGIVCRRRRYAGSGLVARGEDHRQQTRSDNRTWGAGGSRSKAISMLRSPSCES